MCWELCGSCEQAGPEQVMVISGGLCCAKEQKEYIIGDCAWAWCWCTQVQWLNLGIMTILPAVNQCQTSKGVPVSVTGFAQVKVMTDNDEYLHTACEQFLGKTEHEIKRLILGILEGHLRAIIGTMFIEELFQVENRSHSMSEKWPQQIFKKMGIKILSFNIKELSDPTGYLDALGKEQTAKIKSKAAILMAAAEKMLTFMKQNMNVNQNLEIHC